MKRVWNRLVWFLLTLLAGAAWVALWIFIFTLLVGPLGYAWANMVQFWGIFLGLFWITLRSLWVWHDLKRAGDI